MSVGAGRYCLYALPRMQRMLPLFARSLSRRAITGVMALWLCVVAAGVWAPMARAHLAAQGMEPLCTGHGQTQWVRSPAAQADPGDTAALHHLIDCPLCMPVLAPPPSVRGSASPAAAQPGIFAQPAALHLTFLLQWPPARGPPHRTHIL